MDDSLQETCQVCGQRFPRSALVPAATVRAAVVAEIRQTVPSWRPDGYVCQADLDRFRFDYIQSMLQSEEGELSAMEADVLRSLHQHETLSEDVELRFDERLSAGERMADRVASFGGSWRFIGVFASAMAIWILINSLTGNPFDPYPFILLNLALSCLAAVQAPVIMMSQNRQEAKDRIRSQHDYKVNLKAELEIRHLHEKVDRLLRHQWERLVEIQQIQLDLLDELRRNPPGT